MDRRTTLKWVLAAGAAWPLLNDTPRKRTRAAPRRAGCAAPRAATARIPISWRITTPASCGR